MDNNNKVPEVATTDDEIWDLLNLHPDTKDLEGLEMQPTNDVSREQVGEDKTKGGIIGPFWFEVALVPKEVTTKPSTSTNSSQQPANSKSETFVVKKVYRADQGTLVAVEDFPWSLCKKILLEPPVAGKLTKPNPNTPLEPSTVNNANQPSQPKTSAGQTTKRNHTGENVTIQNDKYFVHHRYSALHVAIRRRNHVEVEKLLQNGAKPCFGEGDNCFILSDDNWEIMLKLLQAEPRGARATNWEGGTVLSNNIRHLDRVKYLISIGSDPLENMHTNYEEYNSSSETVMEFAVAEAPIEVLEYLLDIGTLDRTDKIIQKGDHLSKAIHTGDIEKVKLIMKAGVNSSHLNIYFGHHSSNDFVKHPQILKLLHEDEPLDKKILNDILECAVASGKLPVINLVLQYGAEVSNNEFGKGLLIKSLSYPKIVKILLEKGLDPNTLHDYGQTALMLAAKEGLIITVRLLLKHGANPNRRDRRGRTALMHGVHCPETVEALLEHGADLSLKDRKGQTALMKAVRYPNSVKHILEYGANVQAVDYSENTALMKAVPYPDSVKLLLEYGALPWIMNEEGRNALDLTLKYYEFPPKHSSGETNHDVSTIELLLDVACDDNVHLVLYDEQCLFDIYMDCYDDGMFSDEEDSEHHSSDESDEETWGFKAGFYRPPFLNILVEKGFVARLAGVLPPKFLTTILQKMCSKGFRLDTEPYTFSPVTSLLLARLHFSNFDTTTENLKILLSAGMNVGQRWLEFCDRQMFEISNQLQVPDCLLLALMLGNIECLQLLLPYWPRPPLQLLCLVTPYLVDLLFDEIEVWNYSAIYQCLANAGGPLPPGTEMYKQVEACLTTLTSHYETSEYEPRFYNMKNRTQSPDLASKLVDLGSSLPSDDILQEFLNLHARVPSLLELSRVAVRASYPSGMDLPDVLSTLDVPASLQTYLAMRSEIRN